MYCTVMFGIISMFFFFYKQKTAYEMRISDWSSDVCSSDLPDYRSFQDRLRHRERFNQQLEAVFMTDTTANWMARFAGRVPAAPVYDVAQALDNPFVQARQCLLDAHDAEGRAIKSVASPIRCPGEAPLARADRKSPRLNSSQ